MTKASTAPKQPNPSDQDHKKALNALLVDAAKTAKTGEVINVAKEAKQPKPTSA